MAIEKKEVPGTAVTTAGDMPSYLAAMSKGPINGSDNFDSSDVVIPRIKLLQSVSPEVEDYDTAKAGNYWHTGFDKALGQSLDFIVCSRRKRYILSAPMEDGQGVLARADNFTTWDKTGEWNVKIKGMKNPVKWAITSLDVEESGMAKWGTYNPDDENSPPAATLFYDYLVILPDFPEVGAAVLTLARSQIKKARKGLNDKIALHGNTGRPMQAIRFTAKTAKEEGPSGSYFNVAFSSNGFATEDQYKTAVSLSSMLEQYVVQDEAGAVNESRAGDGNKVVDNDMGKNF